MWFRLAKATFNVNLGTMESISKSYMMDYSGLTGLSASPGSVSYASDSTPDATITFTVKSGYVFKSGSKVTASGGASKTYTASADIAAGSSFTMALTGISNKVTFVGAAELISGGNTGGSGGNKPETPVNYTFTINPTPTSATVTLTATGYSAVSGTGSKSITVANGTKVNWSVSADGYTTRTGNWTINGSNKTENIVLTTTGGEGATTWYLDHTNQASSFTSSVNIAGRGWTHKPGTAGYNAYVGKPVNTIGFFTTLASQNITIGKVAEKGGESDMTVIATVTATNPTGTTKGFCSVTFPTVTLNSGECLVIFAQTDDVINFYYNSNASVTDANGIVDGNFYGRVPKVYGSGAAWTAYSEKICLGLSVGYNPDVA